MRVIVTGMNGTVAPALAEALRASGGTVLRWDRAADPPESAAAVGRVIDRHQPDAVAHVATGAPEWAEWIAAACRARGVHLLWVGSVSVFSQAQAAPIGVDREPDATDDYGRYKIECERRVRAANPAAAVARLGWQIGSRPGSNTMMNYFCEEAARGGGGALSVSRRWVPSAAMLGDTGEALFQLLVSRQGGVFHMEGNEAGLSLFDIAVRLNARFAMGWNVQAVDSPERDNRMQDQRVVMGQVAQSL